MTPKQEAALRLALEALKGGLWDYGPGQDEHERCNEVIAICEEALAEPKEKYQYGTPLLDAMTGKTEQPEHVATVNTSSERVDKTAENVHEQPAQQQEPVAWGVDWGKAGDQSCVSIIKRLPGGGIEVLATEYGPPASKPWVGLTPKEIDDLYCEHHDDYGYKLSATGYERAIEAKLREKNGGAA